MAQHLAPLRIWDLLHKTQHAPGYHCFERDMLFDRLARTLQRHEVRHVALVGRSGCGKTTLIHGFAHALLQQRYAGVRPVPLLALDTTHLIQRFSRATTPEALVAHIEQALNSLPACLLVIDDAEKFFTALPDATVTQRILTALTAHHNIQVVALFTEEHWAPMEEVLRPILKLFDVINVSELSTETCETILQDRARYIAGRHHVQLTADVPKATVEYSERLPGPAQPARALRLLDEVCAAATLQAEPVVTRETLARVFAERTGQEAIPTDSVERLRQLKTVLRGRIIGQPHILETVTGIIERGWLGLKNPQRPLGSFLFLGPSGVGKTELARVVAEEVYGTPAAFVRIDMSEFGQPHSVQRLIGAPPGYVGYEAGGQLTSAVLKQPFSLILLDEIEKADSTVFDIFLQILEDGRLTDGHGVTVDFRQTIIMATSNLGVDKIIAGWLRNERVGEQTWLNAHLLPALTARFRLEFLNRFEALAVFTPFDEETLLNIAQLELQKITERVKHHHVTLNVPEHILREKIQEFSDPRFGARPLKRWLEGTVEAALAKQILAA